MITTFWFNPFYYASVIPKLVEVRINLAEVYTDLVGVHIGLEMLRTTESLQQQRLGDAVITPKVLV